jgi:hypothetical protein
MKHDAAHRKPWAVLAYTVADDKAHGAALDRAAQRELKAACDAADFTQVSLAAQVDFKKAARGVYRASITAAPAPMRGFHEVDADKHPLWRRIMESLEQSVMQLEHDRTDLDAADPCVLTDFLRYGSAECPAKKYAVFFYGHAYGPMGLFYDNSSKQRDPRTLRLNDLAGSLAHGTTCAAVVVFRDCFMNTLETAFQLYGATEYIIATQSIAPIAGVWPWAGFMDSLKSESTPTVNVAETIVQKLVDFLEHKDNRKPFAEVPYSLLDLCAVPQLVEPLKQLTNVLDAGRSVPSRARAYGRALDAARIGAPSTPHDPGDPALLDVPTLCDHLQALRPDPVAAPADVMKEVVNSTLISRHFSKSGRHKGVSLYCKPTRQRDMDLSYIQSADEKEQARDEAYYRKLALCKATGWDRVALNPLKGESEKR